MTENHVEAAIEHGYEFKLSQYLSEGWAIFTRNIGGFAGYALLTGVIYIACALIPCIGIIALYVIMPALGMGFYHVANLIQRNQPTQFSDFFRGFDRFGPLFVCFLLLIILMVAVLIPVYLVFFLTLASTMRGGEPNIPLLIIAGLICYLPLIYLFISFTWAPQLVYFHNYDPWAALMTSRKLVHRNWWPTFGMMLLFGLIYAVIAGVAIGPGIGLLMQAAISGEKLTPISMFATLGIGYVVFLLAMLLLGPIFTCVNMAAFADITKLNADEEPENRIEDHFAPM
jgi:hypothetical protein